MRRAQALEHEFAGQSEPSGVPRKSTPREVTYLEGGFAAHVVIPAAGRSSGIRYFLDGTQRTLPFLRCGMVPTAVGMSAVGVVERPAGEECRIVPGSMRLARPWMVPEVPGITETAELAKHLRSSGELVVDPLIDAGYGDDADYALHLQAIYNACLRERELAERRLLVDFWSSRDWTSDDGWIVVDGRLSEPLPGAIGLVKQFSNTYLSAHDAQVLLRLQPGERSSAFRPAGQSAMGERTLWYLRLWNADGQDARHSLIRLETHGGVNTTEEIDRISSWILAERTPRATGDARWATLLYPIHILERALKRTLDAETRGWTAR